MVKRIGLLVIGGALIVLLVSCNMPNRINQVEGNQALTIVAQTFEAQMTLDAAESPSADSTTSPEPGVTQQITITIAPTNTDVPDPTATKEPCDVAGFVRDVTVEDGATMMPGESFTKTWRVVNEGACAWTSDYELFFAKGESMSGPAAVQITTGSVDPGTQLDISVNLVAPDTPGTYRGTWQLRNADDVIFTVDGIWVDIEVISPEIYSSKSSFNVEQTDMADLDEGDSPPIGVEDFLFEYISDDEKVLVPKNSAAFLVVGEEEPSYGKCNESDLKTDDIPINEDLEGFWICFETNEGRLGKFLVVSLDPNDITKKQILELDYVTWKIP